MMKYDIFLGALNRVFVFTVLSLLAQLGSEEKKSFGEKFCCLSLQRFLLGEREGWKQRNRGAVFLFISSFLKGFLLVRCKKIFVYFSASLNFNLDHAFLRIHAQARKGRKFKNVQCDFYSRIFVTSHTFIFPPFRENKNGLHQFLSR